MFSPKRLTQSVLKFVSKRRPENTPSTHHDNEAGPSCRVARTEASSVTPVARTRYSDLVRLAKGERPIATTFSMPLGDLTARESFSLLSEDQVHTFVGDVLGFLPDTITEPPVARIVAGLKFVVDTQSMATLVCAPPCDLLSSEPCYVLYKDA